MSETITERLDEDPKMSLNTVQLANFSQNFNKVISSLIKYENIFENSTSLIYKTITRV